MNAATAVVSNSASSRVATPPACLCWPAGTCPRRSTTCASARPIGLRAQNAFGETVEFTDRGTRLRAICNIGRQDTTIDGIVPHDPGIRVIGGSSDHLILDVEEATTDIQLGAEVAFSVNYGALLGLSTSPYVFKIVRRG